MARRRGSAALPRLPVSEAVGRAALLRRLIQLARTVQGQEEGRIRQLENSLLTEVDSRPEVQRRQLPQSQARARDAAFCQN